MLHLDALFVVLRFVKVENFVLIKEDLEFHSRSLRVFCAIYIGVSMKNFTCASYTPIEKLVCKDQLIRSTLHALEYVHILENKRE